MSKPAGGETQPDWDAIRFFCARAATVIFDHGCDLEERESS